MKRMYWIYALLLTSFVAVSCDNDDDDNDVQFTDKDRSFVENAARTNMYEIELSELAVTQGRDSLVRAYAQRMIDEHTTAQNELKSIADKNNSVDWPGELSDNDQATRDNLEMMQGFAFDSLYMSEQVATHQRAATMHDNTGRTSTSPDVKAYASKYLPRVQDHLQKADSINNVIPARWQEDNGGTGDDLTDGDDDTDGAEG